MRFRLYMAHLVDATRTFFRYMVATSNKCPPLNGAPRGDREQWKYRRYAIGLTPIAHIGDMFQFSLIRH